jgi:hypothetical protein
MKYEIKMIKQELEKLISKQEFSAMTVQERIRAILNRNN